MELKMNCRETDKLLLEHIEHRLDPKTERRVREHLDSCPTCQSVAQRLQRTLALVADDPVPESAIGGERFLQDVRRRIRRSAVRREQFGVRRWIPAFAVAASLLFIAVAVWQFQRTRPMPAGNDLIQEFTSADEDTLDVMSVGTTGTFDTIDDQTVEALSTELVENSDLDDLIDDLSPNQQANLVQALEQLYGWKQS
jgi:predicted anti-sigma-YlaC factor YlaD